MPPETLHDQVLRFLADRDLARLLVARRRAIMDELTALVRLVPEGVLDGRPAATKPAATRPGGTKPAGTKPAGTKEDPP